MQLFSGNDNNDSDSVFHNSGVTGVRGSHVTVSAPPVPTQFLFVYFVSYERTYFDALTSRSL